MSIRFVIGRAGTGKTYHCLHAIRQRLRHDAVDGPRLIFLVPEQASQQMERAMLLPRGDGDEEIAAAHRAEVLSFRRLAFRVLESVGDPVLPALSDAARAMVLRRLIRVDADRLRYYRRPERLGGLVERLGRTLTEFIQEGIAPEHLGDDSPGREQPDASAAQSAKLHDLRRIYAAYLDYLQGGFADPSQYLRVARESFDRCNWLAGAELWVDGFASLSGEEVATLVELARRAAHTEVTGLLDPRLARPHCEDVTLHALFGKPARTYHELRDAFASAGLPIEEPLLLNPTPPPRFARAESLATLEKNWETAPPRPTDPAPPTDVELVELPSRRVEVEYAVSRIVHWVQRHGGYRYRDVAIIARDLEGYHELLSAALQSRGIPFFLDRRRPIAHHPLVELLRGAAAIVSESLSLASIRVLLKTGLLPIRVDQADELENYLLAHGIAGPQAWFGADWEFRRAERLHKDEPNPDRTALLGRVNATRRELVRCLSGWWEFACAPAGRTGKEWAEALLAWLERLQTAGVLEAWARTADADGRPEEADEHRQVWHVALSFLDDLARAFSDTVLTIDDLADVLEAGLSSLTLGLVPPTLDQVLVGAIERSRHPDIKAAVLIGFNDGLFPQRPTEDSILNDDDRVLLRTAGVRLAAPARERVFDEPMLAYIALTRASDALVVTYTTTDDKAKTLLPSPYVQTLLAACGGLTVQTVGDPERERATWDLLGSADLRRRLAMEFRSRPSREDDDTPVRALWNELYDSVRGSLSAEPASRSALRSLDDHGTARLSPHSIERLLGKPFRTSVTQLESYAACPFQFFARYGLRLQKREDAALKAIDVGRVQHAILEDVVGGFAARRARLTDVSEDELLNGLGESCRRVALARPPDGARSDPRNAFLLRRSASHLGRVLRAQRRFVQAGKTRTFAAELAFGFDRAGSLPPLEIALGKDRRALVRGFIDRVDLAELKDELLAVVVDYKRTPRKQLSLAEVYHGLSLQLLSYLLVVADHGRQLAGRTVRPIAAHFVSLASQYVRVHHPDDAQGRELALLGTVRPRGLILADDLDALDTPTEGAWAPCYRAYIKKDGGIGELDKSDAADAAGFERLLAHTRATLTRLCNELLSGEIGAHPYRLSERRPCTFCEMASACRLEWGLDSVRVLEPLKRSEVLQRLADRAAPPNP